MSDKKVSEKKLSDKQIPNNVIPLHSGLCKAEGCKSKATRAEFCEEHFSWFKEGLINKDGQRVPDFDKKHYAWSLRRQDDHKSNKQPQKLPQKKVA